MSNHSTPIVPTVLLIDIQRHPWRLATLERLTVAYHTPTTIRTKDGITKHQHQIYCIPDDDAWGRVIFTQSALQTDLNALADGLRDLGSYAKRLVEAGGIAKAPNPLCFTVISAPDPDTTDYTSWWTNRLVPRIERASIRGHTPKMLRDGRYEDGSAFAQRDHFVCPTDADWVRIEQLRQAAEAKATGWEQLLRNLGTYSEALADGRYTRKEGFMQSTTAPAQRTGVRPASSWGATDLDSAFVGQLESAGYHWEMAKQTPDGRWHHVISSRNTALLRNDQVLLRRERLEALLAPASALATTEQPISAVPMMDKAEARETLDHMRSDLGQIELSLSSFRRRAFEFADRQGWKALGYAGAAEAINAELGTQYSKSYLSRLLKAAEIEKILELPIGNSVPETQLRPLASLDTPDQQRQAWQQATAATNGKPTTGAVQQAVQAIKPTQPNAPAGWVWRDSGALRRLADGRIVGPFGALAATVDAAERADREHLDQRHMAAIEQILHTLDQWDDGARYERCKEAYDHARQIRDLTLHDRAFAQIDRAVEGKSAAPAQPAASFWQAISQARPTAHLWTKVDDHTYRAACGQTTVGAPVGSTEGGHCSSCVRATWPQNQPPAPATFTVATSKGPRDVTPLRSNGVIALHESVAPGGPTTISHMATGRAIAAFGRLASAERAYAQLIGLDWTLTPEGGTGPALGLAITRIITQFDDVDNYDLRKAKLAELEAAVAPPAIEAPPAIDAPADWEVRYDEAERLATKALEYADGSTRFYNIAKAVALAMEFASHLAGERLEDLVEHLDDATYEALAVYRRDRTVPTLESEGIV